MCLGLASGYKKPKKEKVIYICNRKRCENCHPECQHTSDIRFAADFTKVDDTDNTFIQKSNLSFYEELKNGSN